MQIEEKRFETIVSTGASKKKNVLIEGKENRINTLYERYDGGLTDASELLIGLSHHVGSNIRTCTTDFSSSYPFITLFSFKKNFYLQAYISHQCTKTSNLSCQ